MSNPRKQKLEVSITPQEAGYVQVQVYLTKSNYTVYVDPDLPIV